MKERLIVGAIAMFLLCVVILAFDMVRDWRDLSKMRRASEQARERADRDRGWPGDSGTD